MEVILAFLIPTLIALPFFFIIFDGLKSSKGKPTKRYSNLDKIADIKEIEFMKGWDDKHN